jgi:two-component system, OmpR family, alkaline phosphatase synthesis response regulator PhoP
LLLRYLLSFDNKSMKTKRVLIIDDEETIQIVVQFGIRMRAGWDVLTASSGSQGLQTAQAEKPDVILLDVMMPEMDGIDTFKALQAHPETNPSDFSDCQSPNFGKATVP